MTLVPYSNLKPNNLGALLCIARYLAQLGYVFFGLAMVLFLAVTLNYFSQSEPTLVRGSPRYTYQLSLKNKFGGVMHWVNLSILSITFRDLLYCLINYWPKSQEALLQAHQFTMALFKWTFLYPCASCLPLRNSHFSILHVLLASLLLSYFILQ